MPGGVVRRFDELRSITNFLDSATSQPSGLVIAGEPGIGKTTLFVSAIEEASERGFGVLSARAAQAESVLAYAALGDLLADVEPTALSAVPSVQRAALDRVLLRAEDDATATDQRVVAAAVLSVVANLSAEEPLLIALDDGQWLDPSSRAVVAFVARRLKGRVGVLVAERSEPTDPVAGAWLELGRPDGVERIRMQPMSLGGLHTVISERLGRSIPRRTMERIAHVSSGNPFYALELARVADDAAPNTDLELPSSLSELARSRMGRVDSAVEAVLLTAACAADPTVDLLARATGTTPEQTLTLLEDVEASGVIKIDGNRVRFSHSLLASGVYTNATAARRRAVHRSLAAVVTLPELRARHLALGSASEDPTVLEALDDAAESARARGAPAAAAELMEMAMMLGGDTPMRHIRAANHHFQAGDTERAQSLLDEAIAELPAGNPRAAALVLCGAIQIYANDFTDAARGLQRALVDAPDDSALRAQALLLLSYAQINANEFDDSLRHAKSAVEHAEGLGDPALISQVLSMWVTVNCMCGNGVDESALARALELENVEVDVPIVFRARTTKALVLAWTGRLDDARYQMQEVRRGCLHRGADSDMMWIALHSTLIDIWRGRFSDAEIIAQDAMERADQIGGDHMLTIAMTVRALVAAYTGRDHDARSAARTAIEAAERVGSPRVISWPITALAFLEVSVGQHDEALATLQPLLAKFEHGPGTEIVTAAFVPDAVEALVALDRLDEADTLITSLERNGRELDRGWMRAIGARCRGMWLASKGDVDGAARCAQQAMFEHDSLPMPFERARTQIVLAQVRRRQRLKDAAAAELTAAIEAFEQMGAQLWAQRARAELARTNVSPNAALVLTPSEQRVAELVASGMSNRDVAATLFISAKTVEANLSRSYRKLGIRGRAELGRVMADSKAPAPSGSTTRRRKPRSPKPNTAESDQSA